MPAFRYTPWAELDLVGQNVASGLMNYTQELWDNLGTNVVEKNTFLNLDSKTTPKVYPNGNHKYD